ncbi:MAG TPA: pyrroloquinoline quinone biosynthesis protein PqqB [Microvirga sp.]|jgi:pyrroloquinoline quinone biosynthesis protein B|nr:pyrroloquinoline quinone biosynthesis protein PqqB [Microvirga sp.]
MQALILGSAAGGGVPQWNCRCPVCALAWAGDPRVAPRTQSSLAVSADGEHWLLVNAAPDLRQQIAQNAALHPRAGLRHTPIGAVLLTNGDVDHVAGLLSLRESQAFGLFGTRQVLDGLAGNAVFDVVSPRFVERSVVRLHEAFEPVPGLTVTLFPVPGKVPLWLERGEPAIGEATEATVGAIIEAAGRRLAYIPGCALVTEAVRQQIRHADALLFDGTVFMDDDLIRAGVGEKTGWRMGHMPMTGENGSIHALADLAIRDRIFVHLNNTNPVLVEGSDERGFVERAGWRIAYDGMKVML